MRPAPESRAATSQRWLLKSTGKPVCVETKLWVPLFAYVPSNGNDSFVYSMSAQDFYVARNE